MSVRTISICDLCGKPMEDGDCGATYLPSEKFPFQCGEFQDEGSRHICMTCVENVVYMANEQGWATDWRKGDE